MKAIGATLFILVFCHCLAIAQSPVTLTGEVKVKGEGPAPYANVLLLKKADSVLVMGALTDSIGRFSLQALPAEYLVRINYLGYQDVIIPISVTSTETMQALPAIFLSQQAKKLNEVVVTAQKPFLEQKIDRLVVNISNSATSAGATAFEVLSKVPGVVLVNDHLSLSGKTGVVIMINGKPSPYTDMESVIKDIPSSNIDRVEVMNNPGAKYDASGNAGVINLILKKNYRAGFNGNAVIGGGFSTYNQSNVRSDDRNYHRLTGSLAMNYRQGNWNIFGNVDYMRRSVFEVNNYDRVVDGTLYKQTNYYPYQYSTYNFRVGVDYSLSKRTVIGFLLSGYHRNGEGTGRTYTDLLPLHTMKAVDSFRTDNTTNINRTSVTANLNFNHTFDSTGKVLNIDLDVSDYYYRNEGDIRILTADQSIVHQFQRGKTPLNFWTFKADYEHPFSSRLKLETGLKVSSVNIHNDLLFTRNGEYDPHRSNIFKYEEAIYAAYASLTGEHKKLKWQVGLRVERTGNKGYLADTLALKRDYLQLFPSLFIQQEINPNLFIHFTYSRRLDRPDFQLLSPFAYFIDSLTYAKGNPTLLPQLSHAARLSIKPKDWPTFSVAYSYTDRVIYREAPHQEGNVTYMHAENLGDWQNITTELNYPFKIGRKLDGYSGIQAFYNQYKAPFADSLYNQRKWNWQVYGGFTYKFTKTFSAEINAYYTSGQLNEFTLTGSSSGINLGLAKTIMNGKGKITFSVNDIFYKNQTTSRVKYGDVDMKYFYRDDSRNARLTFSWNFGKYKVNSNRERTTGSTEEQDRF
ncbi:outer membrane receptor protein involved in Fe transport [Chitinophaga skermanii]|uniref:Outer membrane receptor protein involved in Fe transport n=1 Tax=Chitinophaga skermanii TaxID=331697 RepID=A0A327R638_9BACT|nr:outer membrane beta-barrel protein [Chitinophaga skermanii]RAJ11154.1 outer membrane receptor protein involved in Fe transport [Chitinophaga skermanii]